MRLHIGFLHLNGSIPRLYMWCGHKAQITKVNVSQILVQFMINMKINLISIWSTIIVDYPMSPTLTNICVQRTLCLLIRIVIGTYLTSNAANLNTKKKFITSLYRLALLFPLKWFTHKSHSIVYVRIKIRKTQFKI